MQQQSPPVSHSSLRYTCPPSTPQPKAPVFAFNIGFYDPGPNEIDPLDCSCLSDDMRNKTSASGDFTVPLHGSTIAQSPLERQRYSSVTHSGLQTPPLSGYTGPPSTPGSTPSPVLLRTSRSSHMRDFRHLHPLRDKRAHGLITQTVFLADPFFQNASPLICPEPCIWRIKGIQTPYLREIGSPKFVELSKRIPHPREPQPRPFDLALQGAKRSSNRNCYPLCLHRCSLSRRQHPQGS